jgi:nanoRNase/pAp phosphatase (c-di-AMP/oligoRNAs hydrolase)
MIGTVASIISKSNEMKEGTYIISMARADDGTTKVSLRIASKRRDAGASVDLRGIADEITKQVGGEAGGHQYAAGAIINTEKEEVFIEDAKRVLAKRTMEEKVVE